MNRAAKAIEMMNSLPFSVRDMIGHKFDNNALSYDAHNGNSPLSHDSERVTSGLIEILRDVQSGAEIDPINFDYVTELLALMCARAEGAEAALKMMGSDAAGLEITNALSGVAGLNKRGGLLDCLIMTGEPATEKTVAYAREKLLK